MRIALTGGIACGKSLVAKCLNELGVETIDADDVVHELLPDPVERRRLAAEIFADPEKRKALEAKLHPQVKERIEAFLRRRGGSPRQDKVDFLFSDAARCRVNKGTLRLRLAVIPLLFETHWDAEYDIICCVTSDRETQVLRMMTTRGYTREEAESRLAAQLPIEEKAAKSHYVIENNGTAEELRVKVAEFVEWLQERNRRIVKSIESSNGGRAAAQPIPLL